MDGILSSVAGWVINIIATLGYPGIVLTMAIESALIPLPSEIIMPFSGFLVSTGKFNFWLVAISGGLGNLIGSLIAYAIGYWGHEKIVRRFIRRWGKFLLITEEDLDTTEVWLKKYGDWVVAGSRLLPGVRTVISLPCGICRLPLKRFIILTFFGSLIWSAILAYIGKIMGENWKEIGPYFHKFDIVIIIILVLGAGLYVWHKLRKKHAKTTPFNASS